MKSLNHIFYLLGVDEVIQHEDYGTYGYNNDISILVLDNEIDLTLHPNIKPACLPLQGQTQPGPGTISGWGTINYRWSAISWLQYADVEIFEDCGYVYENLTTWITDDMICAGNMKGGVGVCNGDSGGPLTAE